MTGPSSEELPSKSQQREGEASGKREAGWRQESKGKNM